MKKILLLTISILSLTFSSSGAFAASAFSSIQWDILVTGKYSVYIASPEVEFVERAGSEATAMLPLLKGVFTNSSPWETGYKDLLKKAGRKVSLYYDSKHELDVKNGKGKNAGIGKVVKMRPPAFSLTLSKGAKTNFTLTDPELDAGLHRGTKKGEAAYSVLMCSENGKGLKKESGARTGYACIVQSGLVKYAVEGAKELGTLSFTEFSSGMQVATKTAYVFVPTMLGGGRSYETMEAARAAFGVFIKAGDFAKGLPGGTDFPTTIDGGHNVSFKGEFKTTIAFPLV